MNREKKTGVVYEVYVQSFNDSNNDGIGDLQGLIEKLDYLKDLGVNILWLTPIFESPMVDNGYDIADYKKIADVYGTMADMDELLEKAHEKGIKIVLDLVVNHTSDKHAWFEASKQSRDNEFSDYYIWKDPKADGSEPSNHGSVFGGSAWEYCPERNQYYLHLFAKEQPDLNWKSKALREAVYETMEFWAKKGVDGFRMDSISLISKPDEFEDAPLLDNKKYGAYYQGITNGEHLHEYLHEMYERVLKPYNLFTIGETPHTDVEQGQLYVDPKREELDMIFQFEHMHVDYGEYGRYSDIAFKLSDLRRDLDHWQKGLSWNSNYLNGKKVRPDIEEKVKKSIAKLHFVRNDAARALKMNESKCVAFVLPTVWSPFFSELTYWIQRYLNEKDYKMILGISENNYEREKSYVKMSIEQRVAGIISISYSDLNSHVPVNIPLVSIEKEDTGLFPLVSSDNYGGGKLAAQELLKRSCKHLVYVGTENNRYSPMLARQAGFVDQCNDSGVEYDIYTVPSSRKRALFESEVTKITKDIVEIHQRAGHLGVFTYSDETAIHFKRELRANGIRIPQDVELIGFDGGKPYINTEFENSSIRQDVQTIAMNAVEILDEQIVGTMQNNSIRRMIPVTFFQGATTTKLNQE